MLTYDVTLDRVDAHGAQARCKDACIAIDSALDGRLDAFNPAELLLAAVGAVRFFPRHPKVFAKVLDGYRRGQAARSMLTVRWEDLWQTPLAELRERFAIRPRAA